MANVGYKKENDTPNRHFLSLSARANVGYKKENDCYVLTINGNVYYEHLLAHTLGLSPEAFINTLINQYNAKLANYPGHKTYQYTSIEDVKKVVEWIQSLLLAKELSRN